MDLADLRREISVLDELTRGAFVEEVLVLPMDEETARGWQERALDRKEPWVFLEGGGRTWAVDRPSSTAGRDPIGAVLYAPLHSQFLGWWLFHAWRSIDLIRGCIDAIASGTTTVAAITSRSLIEELGCLLAEFGVLRAAWDDCKASNLAPAARGERVSSEIGSVLRRFEFASRISSRPSTAPDATNVLTYVAKLDKISRSTLFSEWYDWLSDASHPAFGARLVYVTNPYRDASGATAVRLHSRAPLHLVDSLGRRSEFSYEIHERATVALEICGHLVVAYLKAALAMVDDFGLTTSSASLTNRNYWRKLSPVGDVECPCGCGKWLASQHGWGAHAPEGPTFDWSALIGSVGH